MSAQLKSFEDQLGEKLLKRSGRNLVPTEIGLAVSLLKRARDVVVGVPVLLIWQAVEGKRAFT